MGGPSNAFPVRSDSILLRASSSRARRRNFSSSEMPAPGRRRAGGRLGTPAPGPASPAIPGGPSASSSSPGGSRRGAPETSTPSGKSANSSPSHLLTCLGTIDRFHCKHLQTGHMHDIVPWNWTRGMCTEVGSAFLAVEDPGQIPRPILICAT